VPSTSSKIATRNGSEASSWSGSAGIGGPRIRRCAAAA
jgi:hypothetical protein